jgi:hypothetical protein
MQTKPTTTTSKEHQILISIRVENNPYGIPVLTSLKMETDFEENNTLESSKGYTQEGLELLGNSLVAAMTCVKNKEGKTNFSFVKFCSKSLGRLTTALRPKSKLFKRRKR